MFTIPESIVPFVFLDSSSILRKGKTGILSRRKAPLDQIKRIVSCGEFARLAQNDMEYYNQIMQLYNTGICSAIITMEAINSILPSNDDRILRLFGTVDNDESLVCWEDDISPITFNKAIILITQAKCVIADEVFFSINIGETLKSIIRDLCPLYTLSKTLPSGISNKKILNFTPTEFIQMITEQK